MNSHQEALRQTHPEMQFSLHRHALPQLPLALPRLQLKPVNRVPKSFLFLRQFSQFDSSALLLLVPAAVSASATTGTAVRSRSSRLGRGTLLSIMSQASLLERAFRFQRFLAPDESVNVGRGHVEKMCDARCYFIEKSVLCLM